MTWTEKLLASVRRLHPGCFALVMATGIVSIDASQHGMPGIAYALFAFNLVAYVWLLILTVWRLMLATRVKAVGHMASGEPAALGGVVAHPSGQRAQGSQHPCIAPKTGPVWREDRYRQPLATAMCSVGGRCPPLVRGPWRCNGKLAGQAGLGQCTEVPAGSA
jgi:hypothetical protein